MEKYIIITLIILVGFFKSFAQNENLETPQEIEEEDMVCFLTDANTITCFVAPEEVPQNANSQEPIEYSTPSPGSEDEVKLENEQLVEPQNIEKSNSQKSQPNKKEKDGKMKNNRNTDYDKTKVKMI